MANNARKAVAAATKNASANKEATKPATKAAETSKVSPLTGVVCNVTGGRKHKGKEVGVLWASAKPNGYGSLLARVFDLKDKDEEEFWIDQKHLEATGEKVAKATMDAYEKKREAEVGEMFYIAANVGRVSDKAVQLRYRGWYKDVWFPNADVTKTEKYLTVGTGDDATETPIFEIAAWRVRKECGGDAYDALKAKQDELSKIVNG